MKILFVSDRESTELWDQWDLIGRKRLSDVGLILSAGDLRPDYLEFLVTMANIPCLYVRGNHDGIYDKQPPEGCVDIDEKVCEIQIKDKTTGTRRIIRVAGLGGSMRYLEGPDMYTEKEMTRRVRHLARKIRLGNVVDINGKRVWKKSKSETVNILLTHAPCQGYGDLDDLAHKGFACFNDLLEQTKPHYHCYAHVHMEYGRIEREMQHASGTRLINVSGMYILDV